MVSFRKFFKIVFRVSRLIFSDGRQVPKIALTEKHVKNCELLPNRHVLLSKLTKGGKVAEIGVNQGEFSELILEIAEPNLLHLIDAWNSKTYHAGLFEKVADKFKSLIDNGRVQMHRELSTAAAGGFEDDYFDWIYIDTDHSYATTKEELLRYASKIKRGGIIAGHDYTTGNWNAFCRYGVIEAVHEFCVMHDWELVYLTVEPEGYRSFAVTRIRSDGPIDVES